MTRYFAIPGLGVPVLHGFRNPETAELVGSLTYSYNSGPKTVGPLHATEGREWTVWNGGPIGRVRAAYMSRARGFLIVEAEELEDAGKLIDAIHGIVNLAKQLPPLASEHPLAVELTRLPQPSWTDSELRNAICPEEDPDDLPGRVVSTLSADELAILRVLLPKVVADPHLATALRHLAYSEFLWGFPMSGSYYHCHYQIDRREMTEDDLRRDYMLHRPLFELSFVSVYRGLEAVLNRQQVAKRDCAEALERSPMAIEPAKPWKRVHQVFAGKDAQGTYVELLEEFANIRNAVAAHAAVSPPGRLQLGRDTLLEAQVFLRDLCWSRIGDIPRPSLPEDAYARVTDMRDG